MYNFRVFLLFLTSILVLSGRSAAQGSGDTIIDGVVAIVGAKMILKSDVEAQYLQFRSQGNIQGSPVSVKCTIMENLLLQKLLLNQAEVDSVKVTELMVENELDRRMRYMISQVGSPDKLEEYFSKTVAEIKNDMRDVIREQLMTQEEQSKITKDILITPSEVRAFFKKLSKDSIPEIGSEIQIGIIAKQPIIGEAEKLEVKEKLKNMKERVKKGDDFSTLAILYSEDPGSAKKGGELGMFKRGDMRAEFEAAAFKLKPGEVSDIVETEDGFHLIQLIERRGEYVNARHILLQPKLSIISLSRAKLSLDTVAGLINSKKMTFEDAVKKYSEDPSRNNGGLLINPASGESKFEAAQMDPKIFFVIDKLKQGDLSSPVLYKSERGKEEYRLYFLKERTVPHKANIETDYARIQEMALEKKRMKAVDGWVKEKASKTSIKIMPPYTKMCKFQHDWLLQ
ncbi:MAG: peptidylprolyl isomerase [Bacteroidota bacterium]